MTQIRLFLLIFLSVIFLSAPSKTTTVQQEINRSNQYFKEKQYHKSVNILTNLLNQHIYNSNIYYNLGNCFYEMKEYPKAILFYEKAAKLDRNNVFIQHNLSLASNKALTKIESSKQFFLFQWTNQLMYKYNLKTWSILCLIALWIFSINGFAYFKTKKLKYMIGSLSFLVLGMVLFLICYRNFKYQTNITHAIIMQNGDTFSKPSHLSKLKNTLEAGNKITLLDSDGDFYKAKTNNDKVIWVLKSQVAEF